MENAGWESQLWAKTVQRRWQRYAGDSALHKLLTLETANGILAAIFDVV